MNTIYCTQECAKNERWLNIPGYEDIYSVSSCGRVRRDIASKMHPNPGYIVQSHIHATGYLYISLNNKKCKSYRLHKLVTLAFLGDRPDDQVTNHKDGCKQNNHIINLEYVSQKENSKHAVSLGLIPSGDNFQTEPYKRPRGSKNGKSKLSENQVKEIRQHLKNGLSPYKIAPIYGVKSDAIYHIKKGKTWQHLP